MPGTLAWLEKPEAEVLIPFGTASHAIYHRNYYNGAWGAWANIGL